MKPAMTATETIEMAVAQTVSLPPAATVFYAMTYLRASQVIRAVTTATSSLAMVALSCLIARCGDGVIRQGLETCDDGNEVNTVLA